MKIFNTFTSFKRIKKLPDVDILIWATHLIYNHLLNYRTKIYCAKNDLEFLKSHHLIDLYDEIDSDWLESFYDIPRQLNIDDSKFWFIRKYLCMRHELSINKESVYSDVDILLRRRLDLSHECLFWSPEPAISKDDIYVPWRNLSKPDGYRMPQHVLDTKDAYNCGILYFKDPSLFNKCYDESFAFMTNNPCKIKLHKGRDDVGDLIINDAVWACNAEQRILKAVVTHENANVAFVMDKKAQGWSKHAVHFFYYRAAWRYMNDPDYEVTPNALSMLNLTVLECMSIIEHHCKTIGNFTLLEHFEKMFPEWRDINVKERVFPIKDYR